MRLLAEARSEYDGPVGVQHFDTIFSVDKTISLAHASALSSAVHAPLTLRDLARSIWHAAPARADTSARAKFVRKGHSRNCRAWPRGWPRAANS
jgi:hypothetical protein